jgi:hypothetical protein
VSKVRWAQVPLDGVIASAVSEEERMGKIADAAPNFEEAFKRLSRAKGVGAKRKALNDLDEAFKPIGDAVRDDAYRWDAADENAFDDLARKYDPEYDSEED